MEEYHLLESNGILSKDFTSSSLKKYETACNQIPKGISKSMQQNKKDFYLIFWGFSIFVLVTTCFLKVIWEKSTQGLKNIYLKST